MHYKSSEGQFCSQRFSETVLGADKSWSCEVKWGEDVE